jgi:hypothetical protein
MNKLSLNKILPKKASKDGGESIKLPKGMKVSQLVLIFTCVILLAITILFSVFYLQGLNTKNSLTNDIQLKKDTIVHNPPKNLSDLLAKLNDSVTNLSENAPFPTSLDDKEIAAQFIQTARDKSLPSLSFTPPTTNSTLTIRTIAYPVRTYSISTTLPVKLQKIINFLKALEELPYPTSYIDGLAFSYDSHYGLWNFALNFEVIIRKQ